MNIDEIRAQFPILKTKIHGHPLAYLDNAATTQKPQSVINAFTNYYETLNANVHRGTHWLSEAATDAYENSRAKTAQFLNAQAPTEIVFTGNATEAVNLVAYSWGESHIKAGDEIILSALEHNSNFVPWQQLCLRKGAKLRIIPLDENLQLDYSSYEKWLSKKTKLLAITGMSNVIGLKPDLPRLLEKARAVGAKTFVDASQLIVHEAIDVQKLNCDFLVFTAHKLYGPTGLGILYAKQALLEEMPPFLLGGGMVSAVSETSSTWAQLPDKFEAGTPKIAEAIAFIKALEFVEEIGYPIIQKHEDKLYRQAIDNFKKYDKVKLHLPNPTTSCASVLSFSIEGTHPHDIASIFDQFGVAIRSGKHCTYSLLEELNVPATARLSLAVYNTEAEIATATKALEKVLEIFK